MSSQVFYISVDMELNKSSLLISLFLSKFLADITEVVLYSVMLIQAVHVVKLHVMTVLTMFVVKVPVLAQFASLVEGLLEEQNWLLLNA